MTGEKIRCLQTPKQWCLPTPNNDDQTFTDDWGEYPMFTDTETMVFTDTKNDDQTFTDDWRENSMFTDTETMVFTDTKQ